MVYIRGNVYNNIEKILKFDKWYRVFFSNFFTRVYNVGDVKFVRDVKKNESLKEVIEYLKEIASLLSNDEGGDFLYKQLNKMSVPENTVLAKLFTDKLRTNLDSKILIYPFKTNLSQKEAVEHAMKHDLSVIQGPPGTGKTQTILNIVSNCLYRDQNVAVLSRNNEAIKNVCDKFSDAGYGFLNAFLGNKENITSFFANYQTDSVKLQEKVIELKCLEDELRRITDINNKCLDTIVSLGRLQKEVSELSIEQEINEVEHSILNNAVPKNIIKKQYTSMKLLKLASILEVLPKEKITGFFNRARLLFRFGITNAKGISSHSQEAVAYLKNKYYTQKISELEEKIAIKEDFLAQSDFENIAQKQLELSKEILDSILYEKYQYDSNMIFTSTSYKKEFIEFVKRFPIIYSTTNAIRSCSREGFVYDCVIIDEASQVDLVTAVIAFSCAKRVVLVGDEKQLPHVVNSKQVQFMDEIFKKYKLPDYLNYVQNNALSYINKAEINITKTLLNEHYRCDPQIIEFCNKRFYNDQLVIHNDHQDGNGVTIVKHGSHFFRDHKNERQADIIIKEILPDIKFEHIGIIAPFRAQVRLISQKIDDEIAINHLKKLDYTIDTVHKFQGKERECIILSTVSNKISFYKEEEKTDFLNNENLINVALSRAQKRLYIIASEEILKQDGSIIKDFSKYYEYYCSDTKVMKTNVYSVFDLMYDDYAPILENTKKALLKISDFDSENIIATVIKEICDIGECGALDFVFNYPLKFVLKLDSIRDKDDLKFVSNIKTHCDFLIYSKLNKEILLEIEVDGAQHDQPVQKERDKRKDRLLANAGIKQLRLPTTSIECKEKIISKLMSK